jgi:hypothetical protein
MTELLAGGTAAAPLSMRAAATLTSAVVRAARRLLSELERGRRIDANVLRGAMEAAFGASDATGAWDWKVAYDACEVATVLFLRKFGSVKLAHPVERLLAGRGLNARLQAILHMYSELNRRKCIENFGVFHKTW